MTVLDLGHLGTHPAQRKIIEGNTYKPWFSLLRFLLVTTFCNCPKVSQTPPPSVLKIVFISIITREYLIRMSLALNNHDLRNVPCTSIYHILYDLALQSRCIRRHLAHS